MTDQRRDDQRRDERGSAAVEAVVGVPAFILFVGLIIFGGRTAMTHGAVESAAADAARSASIARDAAEASSDAKTAAEASLANQHIHRLTVTVDIDDSAFSLPVGTPGSGGYTVTSSSNTFSTLISGVTFSVSKLASNVTISVASDSTSISNKVSALVNAANTALAEINGDSAQGAVLQGRSDVRSLAMGIASAVSSGTGRSGGRRLRERDIWWPFRDAVAIPRHANGDIRPCLRRLRSA